MVSRRNYITITMMLLILFFMFQFTGVMKDRLNEYDINAYEESAATGLGAESAFTADAKEGVPEVLCVGAATDDAVAVAEWWCTYSKRSFARVDSLSQCRGTKDVSTQLLLLDGSLVTTAEDVEYLTGLTEQNTSLVFLRLPAYEVIEEHEALRRLLGIRYTLKEETELSGMHLFAGFLLGGEEIYGEKEGEEERQDMQDVIPWYVTGTGTKTYLSGLLSEETIAREVPQEIVAQYQKMSATDRDNALQPAVIWRNSVSGAKVFCVNGPYFMDISGVGILEAMMAELNSYELYPVVNARNLVAAGYPSFASENGETFMEYYSQTLPAVYRDIVWPALGAIGLQTDARLTCMMTPQYDYEDGNEPDGGDLSYYLKLLKESHGEAGISAGNLSGLTMGEKLSRDAGFWNQYAGKYSFLSLYVPEESAALELLETPLGGRIRTVVLGEGQEDTSPEPVISYGSGQTTVQRTVSNGVRHTYMDDFRLKCIETALGYSNIVLDFDRVAYPEDDADSWQNVMKDISTNLTTYWSSFMDFDATTVSESDQRIRRFLALDFSHRRENGAITLNISQFEGQAYFLLRTNGEELFAVQGGSYIGIEEDVYLVTAEQEQLVLNVRTKSGLYYDRSQESGT